MMKYWCSEERLDTSAHKRYTDGALGIRREMSLDQAIGLRPTTRGTIALPRVTLPEDVSAEILQLAPTALKLIESCFGDVQDIAASTESDPETGEFWLDLQLTLPADPDDIADAYDRFVEVWVTAVPWPQLTSFMSLSRQSVALAPVAPETVNLLIGRVVCERPNLLAPPAALP
jgi:hypothetical protein